MSKSQNRKAAFLVLAAISLSFIGLAGPAAGAQTLDITGLRISPNPGYACDNTTISFNVTNNLGTMVDIVTVNVAAKSAVGGMSWQSNITLFANGATSFQSFTWINPPEGTYDVSITVIGAGQIAQKSGIYTVLPCAAHRYIGTVTIVKSPLAPDSATVTVEVGNDGHAPAYNTTVAVQATGPYPDTTRYFIGSAVVPKVDVGGIGRVDIFWQKLPAAGVYNVSAMAIDDNGVIADLKNNVTTLHSQPALMNSVWIVRTVIDPYPPTQGQDSNVTVWLMFEGNWSGIPATVKAYAVGQSSYMLFCVTFTDVIISNLVPVNFSWPAGIEPGDYSLDLSVFGFEPTPITAASTMVKQMPRQKPWLPANFRLELKGLRISPYPALPGQNSTVTVEIANTGDADAPPAKLTVTAEGPAFYNLGTRTTPNTSFGTMVRMEFPWPQPVVPGEYIVRAFLEDVGGNQSDLKRTFVLPHVLETTGSLVNGSTVFNYYYYGGAPNGTSGQNITVVVPATLNETEAAATGLDTVTTGAIVGIAIGSVVSVASMAAYMLGKHKGQMGTVQSNPMYQDRQNAGENPMYKDKGMSGENPLYIHERMVHGVHRGEGIEEPQEASLVGGALPGGAVISSAVSSGVRESPTRPSTGQTSIRESPTKASTGITATDADGDIGAGRMAVTTKGLPGKGSTKKENEAAAAHQRATGGGEELPKESVDYGGAPPQPDQTSNPIPGVGIVVKRTADYGSAVRESPSLPSTGPTSAKQTKTAVVGRVETPLGLQGTRESPTGATAVSEADGDASSAARMAINEKGLPGKKKPSTQRLAGDGTEPVDDDSDDDGLSADRTINKGWDGTIKGVKVDEGGPEAASKKGYDYYQAQSDLNSAGKLRESPTRASAVSTRDSVSSVAQTAGSGGDDMPTESLDQSRKGWDGTIKGVTTDESALGREAAHPVISQVRESPTRASGLRESPTLPSTGQTAVRESPTKASTGQTAIRESPTLPSRDQASGHASGMAIDESGTQVVHARDVATGQASGLRESPTKASLGQTAVRESPTKASTGQTSVRESPTRSDYAIKEQGVKSSQAAPPDGEPMGIRESPTRASGLRESPTLPSKGQTSVRESPSQGSDFGINEQGIKAPESGPGDAAQLAKDEAGKKDFKGHVTLLK